jgi:hypothetical protein
MKKIIILVLTWDDNADYSIMDSAAKNTWGKSSDEVKIYHYYFKPLEFEGVDVVENNIFCSGYESVSRIGHKTLMALEYLLTQDFDYVFRTNSSSFIHIPNLISAMNNFPTEKFYSGRVLPYHTTELNLDFVTGSGYILSRDLVEYVVKNKDNWSHHFADDVSVAKLLKEYDVYPTPHEWVKIIDYTNENEIIQIETSSKYDLINYKSITNNELINEIGDRYHIRCKIESRFDIPSQVRIFEKLNNLIYNK